MASPVPARPRVLLVSLRFESFFDGMYDPLLTDLQSKAAVQRTKKASSAIRLLSETPLPSAVLVTDAGLTHAANSDVWDAVLAYVRQGGTCVVMGHFPTFVQVDEVKSFFAKAGLSWEPGSYRRTTLVLNRGAVGSDAAAGLAPEYSQKAVLLKHVSPSDAWYVTDGDSVVESHVFSPTHVAAGEVAAACARVGSGRLGYVGDVNAERESDAVIAAMCGL